MKMTCSHPGDRSHSEERDAVFAMPQLSDFLEGLREFDERDEHAPEHAFAPASNV